MKGLITDWSTFDIILIMFISIPDETATDDDETSFIFPWTTYLVKSNFEILNLYALLVFLKGKILGLQKLN